jgi:hypothetical protein
VPEHLVDEHARQRFGPFTRELRLCRDKARGLAQGPGGLGKLAFTQCQRRARRGQRFPGLAASQCLRPFVLCEDGPQWTSGLEHPPTWHWFQVASLGAAAYLRQSERADCLDLFERGDPEAAQREGMRHPARVELNEHPDLQVFNSNYRG